MGLLLQLGGGAAATEEVRFRVDARRPTEEEEEEVAAAGVVVSQGGDGARELERELGVRDRRVVDNSDS